MLSLSGYGGSPEPEENHTILPAAVDSSSSAIEIHIVRYHQQCQLLRSCGALLRFPPRPITTALAYLHKYYEAESYGEEVLHMDSCSLVSACLLLASKVEEVPVSNNHLLNSASMLAQAALQGVDPRLLQDPALLAQPCLADTSVLVGPEYYRVKQDVLSLEQVLLRKMHFMLNVDQPHPLLFGMLPDAAAAATAVSGTSSSSILANSSSSRMQQGGQQGGGAALQAELVFRHKLGEMAVCVLNDMLVYSDLIVKHSGALLAAAALHAALLLLAEGGFMPTSTDQFEAAAADVADMASASESWVCEALLSAQARLSLPPTLQSAAAAQSGRARLLLCPTWCAGSGLDPVQVHALAKCVIELLLPAATALATTAEAVHATTANAHAVAALLTGSGAGPGQQ